MYRWNGGLLSQSRWLSHRMLQYYCAGCGVICSLTFLLGFVAADFIGPIKPWWTAEQTAGHYQQHTKGVHGGAALLIVSGMFYLPFSAAISYQMRRIPNLHYLIHQLQLASAAAGVWTFMLPGIILGVTAYRPYRDAEITQVMSDFFWLCALIPWPTFMVQNFAFSYAIIMDDRPKPLFPKEVAIANIIVPVLFTPGIGMHTTLTGPVAFNGALSFWVPGVLFCTQLVLDSFFLALSIRNEAREGSLENKAVSDAQGKDVESALAKDTSGTE